MVASLKNLKTEIDVIKEVTKVNLLNEMELRGSFFILVLGMMINNIAFLALWMVMFRQFGEINGWNGTEVIGLHAMVAIIYGFGYTFFSGATKLVDYVNNGSFDAYLLNPRNIYLRVITSHLRVSAIGDILYGIVTGGIYFYLVGYGIFEMLIFISLIIPSVAIIVSFLVLSSLPSFFMPDASNVSKSLLDLLFAPALNPTGLYQGIPRFVLTFIIPSLILGGIQVEIVRNRSAMMYLTVWLLAIAWTTLVYWLFQKQ